VVLTIEKGRFDAVAERGNNKSCTSIRVNSVKNCQFLRYHVVRPTHVGSAKRTCTTLLRCNSTFRHLYSVAIQRPGTHNYKPEYLLHQLHNESLLNAYKAGLYISCVRAVSREDLAYQPGLRAYEMEGVFHHRTRSLRGKGSGTIGSERTASCTHFGKPCWTSC